MDTRDRPQIRAIGCAAQQVPSCRGDDRFERKLIKDRFHRNDVKFGGLPQDFVDDGLILFHLK